MLAAGGLQHLLQHLHQLLLPIITPASAPTPDLPPQLDPAQVSASSGEQGMASGSSTDSKDKLAVPPEDLDTLLAILEALASADAAADDSPNAQVVTYRCLSSVRPGIVCKGITQCGVSPAQVAVFTVTQHAGSCTSYTVQSHWPQHHTEGCSLIQLHRNWTEQGSKYRILACKSTQTQANSAANHTCYVNL